jgi:hypothetical protein
MMTQKLNDSTVRFLDQTLEASRLLILRLRTKLWCATCQRVEKCVDIFPNRTVLLKCGCRRPLFIRTESEVTAFETAKIQREARRQISGSNNPAKRFEVTYEVADWMEGFQPMEGNA